MKVMNFDIKDVLIYFFYIHYCNFSRYYFKAIIVTLIVDNGIASTNCYSDSLTLRTIRVNESVT